MLRIYGYWLYSAVFCFDDDESWCARVLFLLFVSTLAVLWQLSDFGLSEAI